MLLLLIILTFIFYYYKLLLLLVHFWSVLFKLAQIYIVRKERNPNFTLQFSLKSVYFMRCRREKKKKRRRRRKKKGTKPKFEGFQSLIRIQNFFCLRKAKRKYI